jgi:putative endonuclease
VNADKAPSWQVYIILCADGSLYTGITTDLERRFQQHASGRGAKYFRGRQPLRIVYHESGHTKSSAAKRESHLKSLPRAEKLQLLSSVTVQISAFTPRRG